MMLEIEGLVVGYGAMPVLHGIDLSLKKGEIVTLLGSNGAGKSTLVKSVSGLLRAMTGTIRFNGHPIGGLSPAERLRLGIAHVPEGRQVFAAMTVAENLKLGGYVGPNGKAGQAGRMREAYEQFPVLRERANSTAGNISGGQQQMLAIARGLMSDPRLLLLDEPSLGLAPLLVAEVFRMIRELRDRGLTILLAEQNARSALSIADRGYVIENGRVTLSGAARDLLGSSEIAERYLGGRSIVSQSESKIADLAARLRTCIGDAASDQTLAKP
jgi:branched-chain amino acid transport system ATP-binding protein